VYPVGMSAWRGPVIAAAVGIVVFAMAVPRSSDAAGVVPHEYVGAQRCKSCHAAEFAAWEKSPHARAYDVLDDAAKKSVRCLSCHTLVSEDTQLGMTGVQCESCHGPGRHYTAAWVMQDKELGKLLNLVAKPDAGACQRCHTDAAPTVAPFDFNARRELIKHWK
jgi:hypothetical protein